MLRLAGGLRARDLVELASAITRKGGPDEFDFSYSGYELAMVARHPNDDGVWLGTSARCARYLKVSMESSRRAVSATSTYRPAPNRLMCG